MRSIGKDDHLRNDPPTDDTKQLWLREDACLILQIRNSIDSEVLGLINHCEFVKELLDYLEFLYSGKGNISRIYDVCRAFYRPEKETKTLTTFFMDFKKTYEELKMLLLFSSDIKVQQAQREQMAMRSFLGALPPEFDTAKSHILSGTDITSLQEVFSRVECSAQSPLHLISKTVFLLLTEEGGSEAGKRNNNRGDRGGGDRGGHNGGTSEIVCYYCKEPGHTKRYCKKLQNRNQRAQTTTATVAATSSSSSEKTVTISVDDFRSHTTPSPVTIVDGSNYTVEGFGIVKPTSSITLSSVLSLPSLTFNLMSDLMTKQTIGKGHVADDLYILDAWVPRSVACSGVVSPFEAHCQLGHPSLLVLKKLCPQFHDVSSVDCESCHFAKHHRSSLNPRVNKRAEFAFELVHSDVWGPYVVFSEHSPFFSSKSDSSSKGEDNDWLMYEIFPSVPIEPAISEDRTLEDGLSVPVSVLIEPSNATDGASSGVAQSEEVDCLGEQAIVPSAPVKPPIVQVYSRRREHHDTCPAPAPSSSDPPPNDLDLPICLRKETGKSGAKPCNTPMNPSVHLTKDDGDRLDDPEKYRRLVRKLNYLTVTRKDIGYAVIIVNADWAGSKLDRKSTTGYCAFVGGNLVSWKSKKQSVVSRSSVESEYRAMAQSTCEVMWICHLLEEISLKPPLPAKLWCDNQAALCIASNPVYHERTKHIEVDCHFIREKIQENLISTNYVKTRQQLGDIFTKSLNGTRVEYLCNKLGMINTYAPA
ncbi:hypothetical protein RJ640_003827 [Escallonia rubra]|uniref:CCHC-type domain-containing protein n=1 Tax=Escallonia rubra TaxID=112253 RepID=A0AA88RRS2_9ASTE|nr:hypothetical protein RJ640_003827 [Escallonia rubra]